MHDIRFIRDNPDAFDAALARRGLTAAAESIKALDAERRAAQTAMQELQAKRNELSKQIGVIKSQKGNADALMQDVAAMKDKTATLETQEQEIGAKLHDTLSSLPNMPAADVPQGKDEKDNVEVRKFGEPKNIANAKQHFEVGESLGLMDFETAAKLSGARFTMLKGALARLERALGNFMLDIHTGPIVDTDTSKQGGYTEISPPLMVRDEMMYGTGQLPKFREDQFIAHTPQTYGITTRDALLAQDKDRRLAQDYDKIVSRSLQSKSFWLIPTAEVPLTNIVNDAITNAKDLPLRFTAKTPCFRAEAGAAGKDTRGMLRQHQFYKVEMVSITTPDQSVAEHERMTQCAETILKKLELPFRTMVLCTGDMGFASQKTYDIEVWMPGQNTYREISSCSNCGDFQARRMNARFRREGEKNTEFLHTLNGSGVAVGRCLIAIIENYQNADGSITIPAALRPYMGGMERIG
jgi:seryl-tRNA synthetase